LLKRIVKSNVYTMRSCNVYVYVYTTLFCNVLIDRLYMILEGLRILVIHEWKCKSHHDQEVIVITLTRVVRICQVSRDLMFESDVVDGKIFFC
jgi:hypothetical protein